MHFTTIGLLDKKFTIFGQFYVQYQTIKQLEIHCSSVRNMDKKLADNILNVSILTYLVSKLNLSDKRLFFQERRLRHLLLSGPR